MESSKEKQRWSTMGNFQRRKYKWQINMLKIFDLTSDQEIPWKTAMRYCFSRIKLPKIKNTLFLQRYNGQACFHPADGSINQ